MIPRINPAHAYAHAHAHTVAAARQLGTKSLRRRPAFSSTAASRQQHADAGSASTTTTTTTTTSTASPRSRLGRYLPVAAFLLLGLGAGTTVRHALAPPPAPDPLSAADLALTAHLRAMAAELPLVRALSADPVWTSWDAYDTSSEGVDEDDAHRAQRLTTGPLAGSRGLGGYQRVFHNGDTGEMVAVVWFGAGTSGWPGVVHGGLIGTIVDEMLGRVAIRSLAAHTGVTARLELHYRAPTFAEGFYVVRCASVPDDELPEAQRGKRDRKVWCRGVVETLEGKVCVEASGLFVSPKNLKLLSLGDRF